MDLNKLNQSDLQNRAEVGDTEAQYVLGSRYYTGESLQKDLSIAAEWFEKAAMQGHAKAQYNLGYMYANGEEFDQDLGMAMKWYRLAAELGLAEAQNNLALLNEQNHQLEEAATWYRRAADQGFASAQASLAFALSQGRGLAPDESESVKYYLLAAEQGYAPAQSNLGGMYAEGRGVPLDAGSAVKWIRLATDQGYGPAEKILGDFYAHGFGLSTDIDEAMKWYSRASSKAIPSAQNALAIHYSSSDGESADQLRAFMWFAAAVSEGFQAAKENLKLVPIDTKTEICDLILEAAGGDCEAQRNLAYKLYEGDGIEVDHDAARYWIYKAAQSGDPISQTTYALSLNSNDPNLAAEKILWLSRATEQGDDRARFNLGLMQCIGDGGTQDWVSGMANLFQVSLAGFVEARDTIQKVKQNIPNELWTSIFERVRWPILTFILGPMVEGHLDGIRISQENDDGSDDAEWFVYERETAEKFFLSSEKEDGSIQDTAFEEKVTIEKIYVGRTIHSDKTYASVSINLQNIKLTDGHPVYWMPSEEALEAATNIIGYFGARTWVRWNYLNFQV